MVDPDEFAGRVALVTGAAGKGIGQAIARRLAAGGARVVVTDIHAARTRKVTAEIAADYPAATVVGYPMDAGDREQIDAVGSYAPDVGGSGVEAPYASAKGGLAALTRGLAHDGGPHGIRAVYVSMGIVKGTKFVDDNAEWLSEHKPGPLGDVPGTSDIAEAVAFLASDRAAFITGGVLNVAGGSYMRT